MAGFIQNILWNSVEGFVEAGTRTAGEYAGNALIKAGDMIENGGRGVGNNIERRATAYGSSISGQTYQPSPKALPSTARKPVIKRSNSTPASNKPTTSGTKANTSASRTPLGANKYPGKNQAGAAAGTTKKAITGGVNIAKSTVGGAQRSIPPFKGPSSTSAPNKSLPKPYPNNNNLPKPYSTQSSEKKTAVRPGQIRPFVPPTENKKPDPKKAYPGTNTLPGQGKRVPVQQQRPKGLPTLGPQVGEGQKMQHLAI
ncbi:Nn.00g110150.m01.CDS01 [Neocucurbitaria sp. VM-36]